MGYSSGGKWGVWGPLLLLSLGCSSGERVSDWTGTVETLPNGAVRVINPAEGVWQESEPWLLVPEFSLGKVEGDEWEVFAAITGLETDEQGRIYVLDRQTNKLHIFSQDGNHLSSVGREGSGPGEYVNANGLEWISPDSLLVIDQRGNRYSVLTREGEYVRSVPRRLGFYSRAFRGGLTDGRISEQSFIRSGEDYHPALLSTSLQVDGDVSEVSMVGDTVMLPLSDANLRGLQHPNRTRGNVHGCALRSLLRLPPG